MIVAGVMSGTSADGIDVAITRIYGRDTALRFDLLHHSHIPYSAPVRRFILSHMNAARASVADLARLNFVLGELYADAVRSAGPGVKLNLTSNATFHPGKLGRSVEQWATVLLPIEADVFASYTDLRKGPPPPPEQALRPPLNMPSLEPMDAEETPAPVRGTK